LNATKAPSKFPTIERMTNRLIVILFGVVIALSVMFTTFSLFWNKDHPVPDYWYLEQPTVISCIFIFIFFYFLLLIFDLLIF